MRLSTAVTERRFFIWNIFVSLAAVLFLVWVIYLREAGGNSPSLQFLPAVNAILNSLSALFLCFGIVAILRRNQSMHKACMISALVFSALFLVFYILYHMSHGDTRFLGQGWIRPVYFSILISHIVLSILVLPIIFTTFFFGLSSRFEKHKKIARFTFPIWLYVSVTGVLIFFLLKAYS